MKQITKVTSRTILAPVLSFTLAYEPVHEDLRPHPEHTEERPSSEPERFVGKPSMIVLTSSDATVIWPSPIPRSWPPPAPPDRPPFELA